VLLSDLCFYDTTNRLKTQFDTGAEARNLAVAGELTALFERHVGHSRGALAEVLRDYEGDSLDYPVIRGLAAVLQARCTYTSESMPCKAGGLSTGSEPPVKPAELRSALFRRGPVTRKLDLFCSAGLPANKSWPRRQPNSP
jgi:predicted nuclease of restriction endonuclease-like RecB superfamily